MVFYLQIRISWSFGKIFLHLQIIIGKVSYKNGNEEISGIKNIFTALKEKLPNNEIENKNEEILYYQILRFQNYNLNNLWS